VFNEHYFQSVLGVLVFNDKILLYSKTEEEHEENLRIVLQTLRKHKLYAKFDTCDFYQKKMQYRKFRQNKPNFGQKWSTMI
jgi:hypothetical protein